MSLRLSSISPMVPPKHSGTLHSPASSCLGAHPPVSSWPLQVHSLHLGHPLAFDISTCYGDQAGSIRSRSAEARCVPLWAALQHRGPTWGPLARRPQNRPKSSENGRPRGAPQPHRARRRSAAHASGGRARCGHMPGNGPIAQEAEPAATCGSGSSHVRPGCCSAWRGSQHRRQQVCNGHHHLRWWMTGVQSARAS